MVKKKHLHNDIDRISKKSSDKKNIENTNLITQIEIANQNQDWDCVISLSEQLIKRKPELWKGYWWKGTSHKNLYQYDKAIETFIQLNDKLPNLHQGLQGLIDVANHQKNWGHAKDLSKLFIKKYPRLWQGYWWNGNAHKNLKQYDKAEADYNYLKENFPNLIYGYLGLVEIAHSQRAWDESIKHSQEMVDNHPYFWKGYWYLGNTFQNIQQYEKAINVFKKLSEILPDIHQGLQGLIEVSNHQQDWKKSIYLSEKFIKKHPKLWQGYWWKGNAHKKLRQYNKAKIEFSYLKIHFSKLNYGYSGLFQIYVITDTFEDVMTFYSENNKKINSKEIDLFNFFRRLQRIGLINQAKQVIEEIFKINQESSYGHWAFSTLKARGNDFKSAFSAYENAMQASNSNKKLSRDIILSSRATFTKLKKFEAYEILINELLDEFPNDNRLLIQWVELPLMNNSLHTALEKIIPRYEKALSLREGDLEILSNYLKALLSNDSLDRAENLIEEAVANNPSRTEFFKYYCLIPAYRNHAEEFESRYRKYIIQHPYDSTLFFHHLKSLAKLNREDEIYQDYNTFNAVRFKNGLNDFKLNELQVNSLLKKPTTSNNGFEKNDLLKGFCKEFDDLNFIKYKRMVNNTNNQVLVLCFSGLQKAPKTQYEFNNIQNIEIIEMLSDLDKESFDFSGFAKNTPQFNFLMIKDLSASGFQKDFDQNLQVLGDLVNSIDHKYLVTVGHSGGGFASILFGEYLSANIAYSFSPRLQTFFYTMGSYWRDLQIRYGLYNSETLDMGYMQKSKGGFSCKTYITLCENEPCDSLSVNMLKIDDPNLHVTYCHGDNHNSIQYLGVRNTFSELTKDIENELMNNFNLPINRHIFSQISGFKYNSFLSE